ncbi:MAG: FAD-dependent oxidoreductase [Microcoleaceae cyanobacterium]
MTNTQITHEIVIIGGGAAGITTAAQLLKRKPSLDVAIIEPSDKHYYQPGWTLIGAGVFTPEQVTRDEKLLIPNGAKWIKDAVTKLEPDDNKVITQNGLTIQYKYLIVCPGMKIDWSVIKGLPETLGKNGVTSNYYLEGASYTWELIQNFQGGTALFTFPAGAIKCPGAPQKIMYLAEDYFRNKSGVRNKTQVIYGCATPGIFGVPTFAKSLVKVAADRGIDVRYQHNLKEVRGDKKEAVFDVTTPDGVKEVTINYDMLHVSPSMTAPDFIKESPLAIQEGPGGWVDVNKSTLQHNRYPNVFGLGDASSLPTSKTAAAIRKEAPVLVENLLQLMVKGKLSAQYNGYACCPLITGYDKTIMAEFDYDKKPTPSFPIDPSQEYWSMWFVKKHVLPWLYWNRMLRGEKFEGDTMRKLFKIKD